MDGNEICFWGRGVGKKVEPGITWSMFFQREEGERERKTGTNRKDNTVKGGGVEASKAESVESE